jgi:hypothetical protein
METANSTIDYKKIGASFEMQVNTIKIRNKRKSKGKYGSKHRLPFTPVGSLFIKIQLPSEVLNHFFFKIIEG